MGPNACPYCTGSGITTWLKDGQGISQEPLAHPRHLLSRRYDIALLLLQADHVRQCATCRADFTHIFTMPSLWWADYCQHANGYFGCEDATDNEGAISAVRSWCRFLVKQVSVDAEGVAAYDWHKLDIYVTWQRSTHRTTVLVFDPPPSVAESLPLRLLGDFDSANMCLPFWVYVPLMEDVVRLQHLAVWTIRDLVRAIEKGRTWIDRPAPDYVRLHDLARHAIHVSETLELGTNTVEGILAHHHRLARVLDASASLQVAEGSLNNRLLFYKDMLSSLRLRSASNRDRLQNEIELVFNAVAQFDARISVEIGRAARVDGAATRTIAFITLTFLPGTFVCAIFSMSFFDYDASSDVWLVSADFWRYWAIAIPLTICTSLLWLTWTKLFPPVPIDGTRLERDHKSLWVTSNLRKTKAHGLSA